MKIPDFSKSRSVRASRATLIIGSVPPQFLIDPYHFVQLDDLDQVLLVQLEPWLVLSPLIFDRYDVIDLAQVLVALDYQGQYRAVCSHLPQPDLVREEVARYAPGLDFDLWVFDAPESSG